jgi:hypothetical protein
MLMATVVGAPDRGVRRSKVISKRDRGNARFVKARAALSSVI